MQFCIICSNLCGYSAELVLCLQRWQNRFESAHQIACHLSPVFFLFFSCAANWHPKSGKGLENVFITVACLDSFTVQLQCLDRIG